MANEAQVRTSLQIRTGNLEYQARPTDFNADVAGAKGPTPGAVTASVHGTDISFAELTTPGLCRVMNLSAAYYVEVGVWEPDTLTFYPLLELLPGESYVLRLARRLAGELAGTGSGTAALTGNRTLRLTAVGGPCVVLVEAFEV